MARRTVRLVLRPAYDPLGSSHRYHGHPAITNSLGQNHSWEMVDQPNRQHPTLPLRPYYLGTLRSFFLRLAVIMAKSSGVRTSSIPEPIVIPASQNFEGNDGPWSSFTIRIGSPAQNVNVYMSTASYQTWAVVPEGCTPSDGVDCPKLRGGLFDPRLTTTWIPITKSPNGTDTFRLGLEANLGYSGNGRYGYDTVALGWDGSGGPSLEHQVVGGIATKEFYLGSFGLLTW